MELSISQPQPCHGNHAEVPVEIRLKILNKQLSQTVSVDITDANVHQSLENKCASCAYVHTLLDSCWCLVNSSLIDLYKEQ